MAKRSRDDESSSSSSASTASRQKKRSKSAHKKKDKKEKKSKKSKKSKKEKKEKSSKKSHRRSSPSPPPASASMPFGVALALHTLLSSHPSLASDLSTFLIKLSTGQNIDISQVSECGEAEERKMRGGEKRKTRGGKKRATMLHEQPSFATRCALRSDAA